MTPRNLGYETLTKEDDSQITIPFEDNPQDTENDLGSRELIDIDEAAPKLSTYAKIRKFISNNIIENPKNSLLPSAAESVAGFTYASAATPFITKNTPWYFHPFTTTSGILAINFLLRTSKFDNKLNQKLNRTLRSGLFGVIDAIHRGVLTHEGGHALALLCLYLDSHPQITITPPNGGLTNWGFSPGTKGTLSELGTMFGVQKTHAVISAAGAGAELLYNYGSLITAQAISDDYPEIKSHLRVSTAFSVVTAAYYALSAIWTSETATHDFCSLRDNGGIPPAAAALFLVGSVLLLQLFLSCTTAYCKKVNRENQEPNIEEIRDEEDEAPHPEESTRLLQLRK